MTGTLEQFQNTPPRRRRLVRHLLLGSALSVGLGVSTPALALQPLKQFITSARATSDVVKEADAKTRETQGDLDGARGALGPALVANVSYTRNQFGVSFPVTDANGNVVQTLTIVPENQVDASFGVQLPIIAPRGWNNVAYTGHLHSASAARAAAAALDIEERVVAAYYQVVAAEAAVAAAKRSKAAALEALRLAEIRVKAGSEAALEVHRAKAEAARTDQLVADAGLLVVNSRRSLRSLSGIEPSAGAPQLTISLSPAGSLRQLQTEAKTHAPLLRATHHERAAIDVPVDPIWEGLVPTVDAHFTESYSNATGFLGKNWQWRAGVTASWRLDFSTVSNTRRKIAALDGAIEREKRTRRQLEDRVHGTYHQLTALEAKVTASRARLDAAKAAAKAIRASYQAGSVRQLELIEADRDVTQAELALIQAGADYVVGKATLQLATGKSLVSGGTP